jgi:hypothetical protein
MLPTPPIRAICLALTLSLPNLASALELRLVFGPEAEDVTDQVDWFSARAGLVAEERRSSVTGSLIGYDYAQTLYANENTLDPVTGDLGLELRIGPSLFYFRADVTEDMDILTLTLEDHARVMLAGDDLGPDDFVTIDITGETGMIGSAGLWDAGQGPYFLTPGSYRILFAAPDKGMTAEFDVTLANGDDLVLALN